MSHPLVLALFATASDAARGSAAVHQAGITRDQISIVSRDHDEQGALARAMDATPGADIEDSRPAARFGELSGQLLAAIALVLPGIGPIVAAGPLSADLGEAAGHAAGGVASALKDAGVDDERAEALQKAVREGAVLIGVHAVDGNVTVVRQALADSGATTVEVANWSEGS
jgi:uncharacterized membrane protein